MIAALKKAKDMAANYSGSGWRMNPSHIAEGVIILLLASVCYSLSGMHDDIIILKQNAQAAAATANDVAVLKTHDTDHERRIYRIEYAVLPEQRGERKQ